MPCGASPRPALGSESSASPFLGIYVHWPFCESKCPYCDFNAHAVPGVDQDLWLVAYLRQLDSYFAETGRRHCGSVYFGGGTPSLLDPKVVGGILERIDACWGIGPGTEITLEANPSSSEAARFKGYRSVGVNRVSIGVQSLRDNDLRLLGRLHSADDARAAYEAAAAFPRASIDLMYGRQGQGVDEWTVELREALAWGAEHYSLYQLTIEPGTAFGRRLKAGRLPGLPDEPLAADMFEATVAICSEAGLRQYEISNFARPGGESVHNLAYWRCQDFLGVGPGAHGRISLGGLRAATEAHPEPKIWLESVAKSGTGESIREWLGRRDQAAEYLIMSMRLSEGMDMERHASLNGSGLDPDAASELEADGLVAIDRGRIRTTERGRLLLNTVAARLLP